MTNLFVNYKAKNVGTAGNVLVTANAATQTTIIGLSISNTTLSPIAVNVYVTSSTINYYIVNQATVPVGGALSLFGADGKLVINSGDAFTVQSSTVSSADAILSCLQIS